MSDIKFDIEVTGIKELRQAADNFQRLGKVSSQLAAQYKPLGAQTTKLVAENTKYLRVQKQLAAAVAQGLITEKEAQRAQKEALRAAKERLLTDKTLIDQAKKRRKAEEEARRETERLTKAYAPARVAADLYQKKVREINQAQRRGIITQKEAQQSLALLTKEYYDFTQGVATGGNQFAKFNVETYKANQRLKRFTSTGLQQAGYQFGDFAVQVQSGTNVAVAFGQQMSQLLGIFGAGGALAGAGVAIATAFIAPLIDAKREAEGLDLNLSEVFSTLQENQTTLQQLIEVSLVGPLEQARQKAVAVLEAFKAIDLRETQRAVAKDILPILEGLDQISEAASKVAGDDGALFGLIGGREEGARNAAADIAKEIDVLIAKIGQAARGPAEELPKNLVEAFQALESSGTATDELLKSFKELLESSGVFAAYQKEILDAAEAEAKAKEEQKKKDEEFIKLAIQKRKEAEKEAEKLSETEKLRRKLQDDRLKKEREIQNFLSKTREQRRKELVAEAAESEKARLQSVQKASDQEFALRFANETELFDQKVEVSKDLLKVIEQDAKEAAKRIAKAFEDQDFLFRVRFADETALMQQSLTPAKQKGPEKQRQKTLKNIQDTINALKEQTAQERKLLGLTGERLKEEEIFYDLVLANRDADIKLSEKKLRAIAEEIAAQQEANEMYEKAIGFVDDISDAFSDFVANGLKDFKDFVSSIKDMFVRLLADMAAAAVRNRILIPITTGFMAGAGNAAAGTVAGSGMGSFAAGTIGSTLATGASAFGAGFTSTLGMGTTTTGATAMALNPTLASIGAAAPYILAAVAVIGLFTSKTKKLDEGIRVTVNNMGTLVESFELLQKSRLFGLLKGKKFTEYEEIQDSPIVEAVASMQDSILKAAESLGIGAEAFDNFTYQFQVSLQGLTEQEKIQKINEEIVKMGDAFAELSGHFSTMNELLQVAQQRYDLETRLLELQGNATALLARQREREIASTHELNQGILAQIHAVEDAQLAAQQAAVAVDVAFATVQRSIQARKDVITRAFNDLMENIQLKIDEANENVSVSRSVLGLLESAASSGIGMTREAGMEYLRELRGASRITDQKKLDRALKAIADPSEDLYTNFVDYQRDFADQSNLVRDLENTAKFQLSTDEQTLLELQDQADVAQTRHQEQLDALDAQLDKAQQQIDVMKGVDTSVKSVEQAIADLGVAIQAAMSAQQAAKAAANVKLGTGTNNGMAGVIQANAAGQKILEQIGQSGVAIRASDQAKFQKIQIRGAEQLLEVANQLGVKTSGKTGAEIQQAISNAGNLGVNMDNATRAKEFALGGYFAGGLRMVGERGPELEMTGPSRIMSNNDTRKMLQNPDLVEAVKAMKQEISELRNEQRQLGINNNKYTKRTYDLYRQWDTEGLPAERT